MLICFNDFPDTIQKTIKTATMNIPDETFEQLIKTYTGLSLYIPIRTLKKMWSGKKTGMIGWALKAKRNIKGWFECLEHFGILSAELKTELVAFVLSSNSE